MSQVVELSHVAGCGSAPHCFLKRYVLLSALLRPKSKQRLPRSTARCSNCHAESPTHPAFPAAPLGVLLETDEQIRSQAERIYQQTVVTRAMPIGNLTAMTEAERDIIARWYTALQDP